MATKHTIIVEIDENGNLKSEVQGISGPSCKGLADWLDKLGKAETAETADYRKPAKAVLVQKGKI